jgi:ferrochelatase
MNVDIILVTYGEPPEADFFAQWSFSNRILSKLTRLVAPIPAFAVPLIGAYRGYTRLQLWKQQRYSSPLEAITEKQAEGIAVELKNLDEEINWSVHVAYEFRNPSMHDVLNQIPAHECEQLIIVPMYLPISDFTTDISKRDFQKFQNHATKKLSEPVYITFRYHAKALAEVMAKHVRSETAKLGLSREDLKQFGLLLGCHGTVMHPPPGITDTGYCDTAEMYQLLEQNLASEFQSASIGWLNHRLGGEWTSPTLEDATKTMLEAGIQRFVYYPFGFVADNAETQLEGRMVFDNLGVHDYHHLPCLNENPEFLHFLAKLIIRTVEQSLNSSDNH